MEKTEKFQDSRSASNTPRFAEGRNGIDRGYICGGNVGQINFAGGRRSGGDVLDGRHLRGGDGGYGWG